MVAKAFMSLERFKNYRAYLAGELDQARVKQFDISASGSVEDYKVLSLEIEWLENELKSVDVWIDTRIEDQVRQEQDAAARAWLFPKKRTWIQRFRDKHAPYLGGK